MAISNRIITPTDAATVDVTREALRRVLIARRRELTREIHSRIQDARADASGKSRPSDPAEAGHVEPEDELAFALLGMKSEVLKRINEALQRMDVGLYGYCLDCAAPIAWSRLRALPFSVRCKNCQEYRERSERLANPRMPWSMESTRGPSKTPTNTKV